MIHPRQGYGGQAYIAESHYTHYIVDDQQLKSLQKSLHFLKSGYIVDN
jgi:hypothetical protein